jgi:CBS domain containing-hemolysin-like protein
MDGILPLVLIFVLILLNGIFVAAEFAIIGIRPTRIEQLAEEGSRVAKNLHEILRSPGKVDRYVATAQLGITLASLGLGMIGEPYIAHIAEVPLHDWLGLSSEVTHSVSFVLGLAIITYLHVVLGEMVPKSLSLQNAERTVLLLATPMALMQSVFTFAITGLNKIGLGVLHLIGVPPPSSTSRLHTPDELELIVSESFVGGMLEAEEQQLVANIFDFAERRVSQLMTPRVHIEAVPVDISEQDFLAMLFESNNSRFPVYEDSIDHILGVVHIKDVVHQQVEARPFDLRAMLHDVPAIPESMYAETLLALLKRQHVHMAIVVDEYGGTAGLVTLEDLVEEIVGEVRDEFDTDEEPPIILVEPGHLVVSGSLPIDDLDDYLKLGETEHEVDSVGGLVLAELNRPPAVGDEVTINGIIFRVERVDGFSIERLSIRFTPDADETTDADH